MMFAMSDTWQARLASDVCEALSHRGLLAQAWLLGSAVEDDMDHWSDLDLAVVTPDPVSVNALHTWLPDFDRVWVRDQGGDGERTLHRVVYDDGTSLDLIVATDAGKIRLPGRKLFPEDAESGMSSQPASPHDYHPEPEAWFLKAAIAAKKLGRNDLVIGLHLALDLGRDCLVLAMLLRDNAQGNAHHRFGGAENAMAERLGGLTPGATAVQMGAYILELSNLYMELLGRWDVAGPDPAPLAGLIRKISARGVQSARG